MKVGEYYLDKDDGEIIRITKIDRIEDDRIISIHLKKCSINPITCDSSHEFSLDIFRKFYMHPRGKKLEKRLAEDLLMVEAI